MSLELVELLTGRDTPGARVVVPARRDDDSVVGRERGRGQDARVADELVQRRSRPGVPDARRIVSARRDDLRAVVAEGRTHEPPAMAFQQERPAARSGPDARD